MEPANIEVGDVATRAGTAPDVACDVCSKILRALQTRAETPFGERYKVSLGRVGDLLENECGHADWIRNIQYVGGSSPHYESQQLTLQKKSYDRGAYFEVNMYNTGGSFYGGTSRKFELVLRPEVPGHPGTARALDKQWIDLDLVRDWRIRCMREHSNKCDQSNMKNLRPFKPQWLVDVGESRIVPCVEDNPRFITLSYTWGQTKNLRTTRSNIVDLQKYGALKSSCIASQIPRTIHDAIELTEALGETYLWVDSLCIVQDDEAALAHDLKNMHRIYSTSFLTIIAEDGQDAEYGLRGLKGISSERSTKQLVVPLAGGERIEMMNNALNDRKPSTSDYNQRMWTFQERIFAKRRLVFASGSVKWQCNCAEWSEHHMYYREADEFSRLDELYYINGGLLSRIPWLESLSQLIQPFNSKSLGFEEDVFHAFSGFQTYMNGIFPSGLVFGHPELFFDIALCWYAVGGDLRRRKASRGYAGDPVRDRLPSWSWMGWQGAVIFPEDLEYRQMLCPGEGFTEAITEWHVMELPDSTNRRRLIESKWAQHKNAAPQNMPDGWKHAVFRPPTQWKKFKKYITDFTLLPDSMPKELPSHVYKHTLEDNDSFARQFYSTKGPRWYPVPVKDVHSTEDEEPEPEPHRGYQYLWCETSRAYLFSTTYKAILRSCSSYVQRLHLIEDGHGNEVGVLRLHRRDDSKLLGKDARIELIAVAKGWTNILKKYTTIRVGGFFLDITPPEEEEEERIEKAKRPAIEKDKEVPWMEEWEREKEMKQDCYHVLWIEWKRGIAYRKGSGSVLADAWERLAEPGKVEVILG